MYFTYRKKKQDQDQGLLLNPSTGYFFFEAIPSGGIPHTSFCPPEGATIALSADPNDNPGLSEKPKPCTEDEGFKKGWIMEDLLVADDEKENDDVDEELGAPREGTTSSGSPRVCVIGLGVRMAYASSNSLLKELVATGILANELE